MRTPFIKYIEALVVCKFPVEIILQKIAALPVDLAESFPKEGILEIYNILQESNPEYFSKEDIYPDISWLKQFKIDKMVAFLKKLEIPGGTYGISGAFEMINDPDMYKVISAMAMAKINQTDIELVVNAKFNIHYDPDDINEFLHYFFNVSDWTLTEKKEYSEIISTAKLKRFYNLAIAGDKDYLVWKLGLAPDRSFASMLRDMGMDTFYNFKEKSISQPEEAQKWARLMLSISDKLDKISKESVDKKSIFDDLKFIITETRGKDPRSSDPEPAATGIPHIKLVTEEGQDGE